jgi:phage tail sheath protein FI
MGSILMPGILRKEIDLSEVVAPAGTSVGATVGLTRKGPTNRRTLVTTDKEFFETFGKPVSASANENVYYAAQKFLQESNFMYFVRASNGDERYYNKSFVTSATAASASSNATITEPSSTALVLNSGYEDGNLPNSIYAIEQASVSATLVSYVAPGAYGSNFGVSILTSASTETQGLFDWGYTFDDPTSSGTKSSASDAIWPKVYKINVYQKPEDKPSTYFNDSPQTGISATPLESWLVSNYPNLKDPSGASLYAPYVINGNSQYIYVKVLDNSLPCNTTSVSALAGGSDTSAFTSPTQVKSAWGLFNDKEKVTVNILIAPDEPNSEGNVQVITNVANIAASRQDCIAVGQVGSQVDTTVDKILNTGTYKWNAGMWSVNNPSYFAPYVGYYQVYDSFTDKKLYLPNAIYGAALMARTDSVAKTWDAPAGVNRGILGGTIGQKTVFNSAQLSYLYDNNLNGVKFIRGTGDVMWGQKTAQRKKSALDRISVRRLLLFVENSVEGALLPYLFENNNEKVRFRLFSIVDSFLRGVQAAGGVTAYSVVCDTSNNTPQEIDNETLVLDVYVQPVRTIELIKFNTIITRTGVSLTRV